MRKLIFPLLFLFLLSFGSAQAWFPTMGVGGGAAAAAASYSDILFWLNFENSGGDPTTNDYTLGASECSDGDTTGVTGSAFATASAAARYGTYGGDAPTGGDEVEFTVSSNDIVSGTAGSIGLNVRIVTWSDLANIFSIFLTVSDTEFKLDMDGDADTDIELRVTWESGNSVEHRSSSTAANMVENTWYHIQVFYDAGVGAGSDYITVEVDGTAVLTITGETLTPLAVTSAAYGERNGAGGSDFHIDNVMVSDDPTREWYDSGLYDDLTVVGLTDACDG